MPRSSTKNSLEYSLKRVRNNIAVKKSREKAKLRSKEVAKKIQILREQNKGLAEKLEEQRREIMFYKNALKSNFNDLPPSLHEKIKKAFDENFR